MRTTDRSGDTSLLIESLLAGRELPLPARLEVAERFERAVGGSGPRLPSAQVGPLARMLAVDEWHEVRKKVANVLDRLDDETFEAVAPALLDDPNYHVCQAARRIKIRRWRAQRHSSHKQKVLSAVAKLAPEFHEETADASARLPQYAWQLADPNEPVSLRQFIERFCQHVTDAQSKHVLLTKSIYRRLIPAPPLAVAHRRGGGNYYRVRDLANIWPTWQGTLPLPPLKTN